MVGNIIQKRMTAQIEGDFVIFLIGMRINKPLLVHKWIPAALSMPRMLRELTEKPELGLLNAEMWYGRNIIVVQYWRSLDHLLAYSKKRDSEHLPAWQAFNRNIGTNGVVGIWHETYLIAESKYESLYVNMPHFGMGKFGKLVEASSGLQSASGRLGINKSE